MMHSGDNIKNNGLAEETPKVSMPGISLLALQEASSVAGNGPQTTARSSAPTETRDLGARQFMPLLPPLPPPFFFQQPQEHQAPPPMMAVNPALPQAQVPPAHQSILQWALEEAEAVLGLDDSDDDEEDGPQVDMERALASMDIGNGLTWR